MVKLNEYAFGLSSPAYDFVPVVPDDNNDLPSLARSIVVSGAAGDIAIVTASGNERVIPASIAGVGRDIPVAIVRIKSTGTTATGIIAYV